MCDELIAQYSSVYGIPIPWIEAVIDVESSFMPTAVSNKGARGLMQIMPATGHDYGVTNPDDLFDPAINIDVGTHLLSDLRDRLGDDVAAIYSAYNSGKPDLYLTSAEVAANVDRFLNRLEYYLQQEPLIATGGAAGGLVVLLLVWLWTKGPKPKVRRP